MTERAGCNDRTAMTDRTSVIDSAVWLEVCQRASAAIGNLLSEVVGISARARETGSRGSGGDRTLVLDAGAEQLVFDELDRLHSSGLNFRAISEERGEVKLGADTPVVVIDPIDGSLNAKRGACHHALSIAVADGPTMADVRFGYVFDFGTGEEWWASSGEGAYLNGALLDPESPERLTADGRLELLALESADPRWMRSAGNGLVDSAHRLRVLGAIAVSLCQVAAARVDGMLTLRNCRAVDAAAGQLIVREAGGFVSFPSFEPPLAAALDTAPHSPVVAARTEASLKRLEDLCRAR